MTRFRPTFPYARDAVEAAGADPDDVRARQAILSWVRDNLDPVQIKTLVDDLQAVLEDLGVNRADSGKPAHERVVAEKADHLAARQRLGQDRALDRSANFAKRWPEAARIGRS